MNFSVVGDWGGANKGMGRAGNQKEFVYFLITESEKNSKNTTNLSSTLKNSRSVETACQCQRKTSSGHVRSTFSLTDELTRK